MIRCTLALALSLVASSLSANINFEPPNPVAGQQVIAHVSAVGCRPTGATVHQAGRIISIALDVPQCFRAELFEFPVSLGAPPAGVYDVVASPGQLLSLIAEGFLTVRDAAPPFDVVPNLANPAGGELIHLRAHSGTPLYNCFNNTNPPVCDLASVKIGGQTAQIQSATQAEIVVKTPAHDPGAVDVTIVHNDGSETTATAALDYVGDRLDSAFFEPVVFPAIVNGAGALGARWQTTLTLRNDNDLPMGYFQDIPPLHCIQCSLLLPHTTFPLIGPSIPGGFVLYVPRQLAPQLWFQLLARDLSRQSESFGTDIPVVREKDLYGRPFELLNVPLDPKFRVSLRALRLDGGNEVRVRIYSTLNDDATAQPVIDTTLALAPAPFPPAGTYMSGAILDLVGAFPQKLGGVDSVRIVIDGETTAPVTWGFASVTNNATQQITIVAPH